MSFIKKYLNSILKESISKDTLSKNIYQPVVSHLVESGKNISTVCSFNTTSDPIPLYKNQTNQLTIASDDASTSDLMHIIQNGEKTLY